MELLRENQNPKKSIFNERGLPQTVETLCAEIREIYEADGFPWVVGYSGGKDSTAVLQLVWLALEGLEPERRKKPVYVISTDTLVENPVVASWVSRSLVALGESAEKKGLPIIPNRLTPEVGNTFWVNLIGRGYPAPRPKFRWCTERLKINPSNKFITDVVRESGEAILVLGTRKAESAARARTMTRHEEGRTRHRLSPNASLPNSLVYTPVEDWSNDDVWLFLMQVPNPWGHPNKELLTMYQGASPDGECPLVVDTSTPSCGDSRFGCWVCTLVDKDKSMSAMIQNDEEREWMLPLLELRDRLDVADDRHLRDFRRMSGHVQLFHDAPIPGPYTQEVRANWLREVLQAQSWIRKNGPPHVRELELISLDEMREIRRIWLVDKHELEDLLPAIYESEVGSEFPDDKFSNSPFGADELGLLAELCGDAFLHYEMLRNLIDVERSFRTSSRRAGVFRDLESVIRRCFYENEEDATDRARARRDRLAEIRMEDPEPTPAGSPAASTAETNGQGALFNRAAETAKAGRPS